MQIQSIKSVNIKKYEIKLNNLNAPIQKGEVVGKLNIKENGKHIRTIDLTIKQDVKKANIGELYLRYIKDILTGDITI